MILLSFFRIFCLKINVIKQFKHFFSKHFIQYYYINIVLLILIKSLESNFLINKKIIVKIYVLLIQTTENLEIKNLLSCFVSGIIFLITDHVYYKHLNNTFIETIIKIAFEIHFALQRLSKQKSTKQIQTKWRTCHKYTVKIYSEK